MVSGLSAGACAVVFSQQWYYVASFSLCCSPSGFFELARRLRSPQETLNGYHKKFFIFMVTLTLEFFILTFLSFVIIFANYILVFSSPCLALKDLSLRQMPSIAAFKHSLSSAKFKVHFLSCVVELFTLYSSFYPVLQWFYIVTYVDSLRL